jgi:hypothetical protein
MTELIVGGTLPASLECLRVSSSEKYAYGLFSSKEERKNLHLKRLYMTKCPDTQETIINLLQALPNLELLDFESIIHVHGIWEEFSAPNAPPIKELAVRCAVAGEYAPSMGHVKTSKIQHLKISWCVYNQFELENPRAPEKRSVPGPNRVRATVEKCPCWRSTFMTVPFSYTI